MKPKLILLLTAITFFSASMLLSKKSFSEVFDSEKTSALFTAGTWDVEEAKDTSQNQEPEVLLYTNASDTKVGFTANNVSGFDKLKYNITYSHKTEFGSIDELISGELDNAGHENVLSDEWFILGSCSSGGTCVYYEGIEKIDISIELISGGSTQKTINDTLAF